MTPKCSPFSAAVLVAAIVGSSFGSRCSAAEPPPPEILVDGVDTLFIVDLSGVYQSPAFKKFLNKYPALATLLDNPIGPGKKLKPRSFSAVYLAINMSDDAGTVAMRVDLKLKGQGLNPKDLAVEKVGERELFRLPEDNAGFVVGENTIVAGPYATVRKVLERNGPAELRPDLSDVLRNIPKDSDGFFVAVSDAAAGFVQSLLAAPAAAAPIAPRIKWASASIDADERVTIRARIGCSDPETADRLQSILGVDLYKRRSISETPANLVRSIETMQLDVEAAVVTLQIDVDMDFFLRLIPPEYIPIKEK